MALFVNKHQGRAKDDEFYTLEQDWKNIDNEIEN